MPSVFRVQRGKNVSINLTDDSGTRRFTEFWQKMIDEGLVNTSLSTWSDGWKEAVGNGTVASMFSGAWMPSLLMSDLPGTAAYGVYPDADPGWQAATAENGGSALACCSVLVSPKLLSVHRIRMS